VLDLIYKKRFTKRQLTSRTSTMSTSRTVNRDKVGVFQFTFTVGHLSCRVYWLQCHSYLPHIQRAEISIL